MRILLISPLADPAQRTPVGLMIPQAGLHILEGLTTPEHQVRIVEEEIEKIDLDQECDLVGISCLTSNAPRSYRLAGEFRRRGRKVVLGGVHPSILYEEAIQHADAVVVGEAEGVWEQLLLDLQAGRLKKRYQAPAPSLDRYIPMVTRQATKKRLFNVIPVMTTRGCPYRCEFCCVSDLYGPKIRHVPVRHIVRDIAGSGKRIYIFLDDNIIGDPRYAKELFRAITPYRIKWCGQASISFVHDTELMKLAAESGCQALFFGVETVSEEKLKTMRKAIKSLAGVEDAIARVRDLGIHFHASMVFGFDSDTTAVFPETLEFLRRNKIGTASFNILTPYPGTRVYDQFRREKRLLTTDWKYYDHSTVVYKPKNMSPYQLQEGTLWVKGQFTKMSSIMQRLPQNLAHPMIYLAMNLGMRMFIRKDNRRLMVLEREVFGGGGAEAGSP